MNVLSNLKIKINEQKVYYMLVLLFFVVGIALGTFLVRYMNAGDLKDISDYFTSFLTNIVENPVDSKSLLLDVLIKNTALIGFIILLGFTFFGTPFILLIDLLKGFTLGYTFSFLLTTYNGKGIWVALASTIPQNIIYIPIFIALSIICIEYSTSKMKEKFFNKGSMNKLLSNDLIYKFGALIIIFVIGVFIESYICPNIIKFAITKAY
ncbi:MAG: stage II sporulation protein M [Clostridium sp.]